MVSGEAISVIMIGCGKVSQYYHVPALEADAAVTFAGIFDPSPGDGARQIARRAGATLVDSMTHCPNPQPRRWRLSQRRMRFTPPMWPPP